jgi:hypothetical protein
VTSNSYPPPGICQQGTSLRIPNPTDEPINSRLPAVRRNGDLVRERAQQFLPCQVKEHGIVKEHGVSWVRPPIRSPVLAAGPAWEGIAGRIAELRNQVTKTGAATIERPRPAASGRQY